MRLKRLELQGFKSFVDRTILPFEAGITGVVGPNGCGKSNIVDAIQWVMGEQSAKHLRGDSMSDVIFNGSETRPATSMAEVSLVMDATGINLPPHLIPIAKGDELTITRRLYRDGEAEYLINKQPVRLKDVHEIFMDTGVGRRAYSIIEQGQIDRMINVKPDDRRVIFEEVAGITKYKTKRREAERKLEQTKLNIERVDDIVRELEKQIRSLKIQATRARKYKEIKAELEQVDLFLLGRKLYSLKESLAVLEKEKDKLRAVRSEFDAEFSRVEAQATELEVRRLDEEKAIESAEQRERELALKVQKLENQLALLQQEKEHLEQSRQARTVELSGLDDEILKVGEELATVQAEREGIEASRQSIAEQVEGLEEKERELRGRRETLEREKKTAAQAFTRASERIIHVENQQTHGEQRLAELMEKSETINAKTAETVASLERVKGELTAAEEKIVDCQARAERVQNEATELYRECQQISERLSETEDALFEAREAFHAKNSRLESLKELQQNLEGYSPTAREILLKMEGVSGVPLAEVINPDPEIEALVESLLGEAMNTIVVDTTETAARITRNIREQQLERVGILSREESAPVTGPVSVPEGAQPLLSRVRVRPGFEAVVDRWLGDIFIVPDDAALFALRERHPEASFITPDAILSAQAKGLLRCGTAATQQGIFARRREIEALEVTCAELSSRVDELNSSRETLLAELETQEKRHEELKDRLSSLHIEAVEYRKEREKLQLDRDRIDRQYNLLVEDAEANSRQMDELKASLEKWAAELTSLQADRGTAEARVAEIEAALEAGEAEVSTCVAELGAARIERSKLDERAVALAGRQSQLDSQRVQLAARKDALEAKNAESAEKIASIDVDSERVRTDRDATSSDVNALVAELAEMKETYAETSHLLNELRERKDAVQSERAQALDQLQGVEIRLAEERSNYDHQRNISIERYQREAAPRDDSAELNLAELPMLQGQVEDQWLSLPIEEKDALLEEHVENLRGKVARYGEVNLTAIAEFDEVQKRHDFLQEQKQDLEKSVSILEQAIKKIDETTKERFLDTFEGVNEKFREVFPILFNGGKANLALTNPENLLESGVDIMAQPPGKRLQSITLLSGGEKALTAVSLVLAIFARKPSPFCLLDEVDAPLDEANVSRFNTVIKRMAKKSQFILVTHNRKTMDIVDALFGVTMEQSGISKMTSVRLN